MVASDEHMTNGVRCVIHTDKAAKQGTAEYDRRVAVANRAAYAIQLDYAAKTAAKESNRQQ